MRRAHADHVRGGRHKAAATQGVDLPVSNYGGEASGENAGSIHNRKKEGKGGNAKSTAASRGGLSEECKKALEALKGEVKKIREDDWKFRVPNELADKLALARHQRGDRAVP
mmetsp:Transcript_33240/g.65964  ORF Transcript_33240/g.65964 Transcript_33240/m.65964 type:complete len:112 (-) Transcript_33240:150-485(-)